MVTNWLTLLTSWLTVTLMAAGGPTSVTVEPTSSFEAPPGTQMALTCGENDGTGELQFWHTPFGDLQTSGFQGDAVLLQPDRSLLITNSSTLHSGFYYCLLQLREETRLQPYQLQVHRSGREGGPEAGGPETAGPETGGPEAAGPEAGGPEAAGPETGGPEAAGPETGGPEAGGPEAAGPETGGPEAAGPEAGGPEAAGPEAAGPENGSPEAAGPGEQQGVSDGLFAGAVAASVLITFVLGFSVGALTRSQVLRCFTAVTMKLKSPRRRQPDILDHGPEVAMTTLPPMFDNQEMETVSSTTSSPPKKPQRSFRHKRDEETTAYLQGCDHKQDEGSDEEKVEGSDVEKVEGSDEKVEGSDQTSGFCMVGGNGGSETEGSDDDEKKDEAGQTAVRDSAETGTSKNQEMKPEAPASRPGRRVIRLYNYDEDGQRYQHLPDLAPQEPSPAHRLKQRSLSLTRLNAIMAAASASPLDRKETESEATPRFHMEI